MTTSSEYVLSLILAGKELLPFESFKAKFMACTAPYIIVDGETGSGKSMLGPWWLCEMGYRVLVTEPLIESVVGTSEFLASKMGVELGTTVGYRTAEQKCDSRDTKILFVTDGLALVRALAGHNKFDVLVIDELHQWTTNQSTLEAWAWKLLQSGQAPFKRIVVLSATLDSQGLSRKRGNAPIFKVPGRQFQIIDRAPGVSIESDIRQFVSEGHDVLCFQPTQVSIENCIKELKGLDAELIPFHGRLTRAEKDRAYETNYARPKVIISTNALETGRTVVPNKGRLLAVVDSGLERRNEVNGGIEGSFIRAISIAHEKQRRGRTGRVDIGYWVSHCPATVRDAYPVPEMLRTQLSSTILRLAIAGFDASDLPFFHELPEGAIDEGIRSLVALGAFGCVGNVTRIGRRIPKLPVDVHIARMILEAARLRVGGSMLTIAACMMVGGIRDNTKYWKPLTRETMSDALAERDIFEAINRVSDTVDFEKAGVFGKAFFQARALRDKLEEAAKRLGINTSTSGDRVALIKAICAGMVDHLYKSGEKQFYASVGRPLPRSLYHKSVIRRRYHRPDWVVGQPIDLEMANKEGELRTQNLLTMVTGVELEWLVEVAPHLVSWRRRDYRFDYASQSVRCDRVLLFNEHELESQEIEPDRESDEEARKVWEAEFASQAAKRLDLAWKAFQMFHRERAVSVKGFAPLPQLPAPEVYDAQTGAVAYPAVDKRPNAWVVSWFRSQAEAEESQAKAVAAKAVLDHEEKKRRERSSEAHAPRSTSSRKVRGNRARAAASAPDDSAALMDSRLAELASMFRKR